MTAPKSSPPKFDIHWLSIVKAFWNGRLLAASIAAILSVVGVFVVRNLPTIYKAEALVLVDSQKIPERFVSPTVTAEVQDRLTTISQEMLSRTRLQKIIQDFNLYEGKRKTLVQEEITELMRKDIEVKVERPGGGNRPGAFRISYQGDNPVVVAQVTNRIADLYIQENLRTREVQAEGTSEFINHQLEEAKKQLDSLEAAVGRYKLQHNGELPQQEASLVNTLGRLQAELNGNQDALNRAEQTRVVLQNGLVLAENNEAMIVRALRKPAPQPGSPEAALALAAAVRPPTRVEQLTSQLQALRVRYSDAHPEVKRMIGELERARAQEAEERKLAAAEPAQPAATPANSAAPAPLPTVSADGTITARDLNQAQERTATLRSQLAALDQEVRARHADRQRILRDMSIYQARIERLPLREQEMAALTRDYDIAKANYRSLQDKKIAADMAGELERRQKAEKFTILDAAKVPEKPYKPNRPMLYAAVVLLGVAVGSAMAIARELLQNRLLGEWELPSGIPLLGRVPHIDTVRPSWAPLPRGPATLQARPLAGRPEGA